MSSGSMAPSSLLVSGWAGLAAEGALSAERLSPEDALSAEAGLGAEAALWVPAAGAFSVCGS